MRSFAKEMGIPAATWQREFNRGKTAETVRDPRRPNRWTYGEYDAGKAQDEINRNAANKGCPMAVTNILAEKFAHLVKVRKLSPYDAVRRMEEDEELKGKRIPKASTLYKHIRHGDIPVHYGDTPYHPDRERRKGPKPHEAKTVPGRLQLSDRPREANERLEPGHWEMDTVVSCINGVGGLLVLIDRFTREYRIELVREISQRAIIKALKRLRKIRRIQAAYNKARHAGGDLSPFAARHQQPAHEPRRGTTIECPVFGKPKTAKPLTECLSYLTNWELAR